MGFFFFKLSSHSFSGAGQAIFFKKIKNNNCSAESESGAKIHLALRGQVKCRLPQLLISLPQQHLRCLRSLTQHKLAPAANIQPSCWQLLPVSRPPPPARLRLNVKRLRSWRRSPLQLPSAGGQQFKPPALTLPTHTSCKAGATLTWYVKLANIQKGSREKKTWERERLLLTLPWGRDAWFITFLFLRRWV